MFESRRRGPLLSGTLNLRYAVCETSTFLIWEDFATDRVGCRAGGDVPIAVQVAGLSAWRTTCSIRNNIFCLRLVSIPLDRSMPGNFGEPKIPSTF